MTRAEWARAAREFWSMFDATIRAVEVEGRRISTAWLAEECERRAQGLEVETGP